MYFQVVNINQKQKKKIQQTFTKHCQEYFQVLGDPPLLFLGGGPGGGMVCGRETIKCIKHT